MKTEITVKAKEHQTILYNWAYIRTNPGVYVTDCGNYIIHHMDENKVSFFILAFGTGERIEFIPNKNNWHTRGTTFKKYPHTLNISFSN